MASSDDFMTVDHRWALRPSFSDAWISDVFASEADTFTKALQVSSAAGDPLFFNPDKAPTDSGCSNEASAAVSKPRRSGPPIGGRVSKRKPRASKRATTTTFIAADAANFRRMVQEVTGVRFDGMPASAVLKPEPLRAEMGGGLPTTFDASGFFADDSASTVVAPAPERGDGNGIAFDSYYSFPTLESYVIN